MADDEAEPLSPREALRAKVRERAAPEYSAFVTDEMIAARTARHVSSRHFLTVIDKNFPPAALSRLPRDQRVAATAALLEAIASDVPEVNDEPGEDEDDTIAQTIEGSADGDDALAVTAALELRASRNAVLQALEALQIRLRPARLAKVLSEVVDAALDDAGTVDLVAFLSVYLAVWRPQREYGRHLRKASQRGDVELAYELMARGVDPAGVDGNGYTALHCAADMGEEDTIELLLTPEEEEDAAKGGPAEWWSLNVEAKDNDGWTALHCSSGSGWEGCVKALLNHGANVEAYTNHGRTPLLVAAGRGRLAVCEILLEAGALVGAQDKTGRSAGHLAMAGRHAEVARLLLGPSGDDTAEKGKKAKKGEKKEAPALLPTTVLGNRDAWAFADEETAKRVREDGKDDGGE